MDIKTQMLVAEQVHWLPFEKVRSKNVETLQAIIYTMRYKIQCD